MNCLKNVLLKEKLPDLRRTNIIRWISSEKSQDAETRAVLPKYFTEEKKEWNILKAFASKKNSFLELHRYGPFQVTSERLRMWKQRTLKDADILDQKYIEERHSILGNDLATAHFIVFRGGKVKFLGQPDWILKAKNDEDFTGLPKKFTEGWFLESVDASGLPLRYEAFENFKDLYELKTLILCNCPNIDEWCLDRISSEFQNSLEHLDLSDCPKVTERSLACFYRFRKLKTLKLNNIVKSRSFEYACLLLEEALPQLTISGVNYIDMAKPNEIT